MSSLETASIVYYFICTSLSLSVLTAIFQVDPG